MSVPAGTREPLADATTVGAVTLTVAQLATARAFYEQVIGLVALGGDATPDAVALGTSDGRALVVLREDADAPALDPRAPGLFHLALLHPGRRELAQTLQRVAEARWPLTGASDHLVSEALYLRDPEGNGIELYHDRPRERWPHDAAGAIRMDTLALDPDDLLGELEPGAATPTRIAPATVMGHVHLQVSDVVEAEAFYAGVLGFAVTVRAYPGALFVSAGGYHHHLGLNTWNSRGASPAADGALGLARYEILVPGHRELARVRARLLAADVSLRSTEDGSEIQLRDPFGNGISLRAV